MANVEQKDAGSECFSDTGTDTVVSLCDVSKKFCKHLKRSMAYGVVDLLKNLLGIKSEFTGLRKDEFWALDNISFKLKRGETFGIIGANGSGKTTLLRLLAGILPPDRGEISIAGRLGALIAVGAGFHPHMTGHENIFLNGAILGMSKKEIHQYFDAIVGFADIGDFLESPISTYSSGMRVRLGFSIAIHAEVAILLVDEVLAVGDLGFQLKCFNKIGELRKKGMAAIIVSHNMHLISSFCDRVVVLNKGRILHNGSVEEGIRIYRNHLGFYTPQEGEIEKVATGCENFKISAIKFSPPMIDGKVVMKGSSDLEILITYEALQEFRDLEIDISMRLPLPMPADFFQASNKAYAKELNAPKGKGSLRITIKNINLNNFSSLLYVAVWEKKREKLILWWRNIPVVMPGNPLMSGWSCFNIDYQVLPEVSGLNP